MKLKSRSTECVVCNYLRMRSFSAPFSPVKDRSSTDFTCIACSSFKLRTNCHCVSLSLSLLLLLPVFSPVRAKKNPPGLEKTCHSYASPENAGSIVSDIAGVVELTAELNFYKILFSHSVRPLLVKMFRSRNWAFFRLTGLE